MADRLLAYDAQLAERIRAAVARRKGVIEKRLFGGLGFLLRGNLLVCIWKTALIVRLGPEEATRALQEPYVGDFDITGRPMRGWVMVSAAGVADDADVQLWVRRAWKFVSRLPAK